MLQTLEDSSHERGGGASRVIQANEIPSLSFTFIVKRIALCVPSNDQDWSSVNMQFASCNKLVEEHKYIKLINRGYFINAFPFLHKCEQPPRALSATTCHQTKTSFKDQSHTGAIYSCRTLRAGQMRIHSSLPRTIRAWNMPGVRFVCHNNEM